LNHSVPVPGQQHQQCVDSGDGGAHEAQHISKKAKLFDFMSAAKAKRTCTQPSDTDVSQLFDLFKSDTDVAEYGLKIFNNKHVTGSRPLAIKLFRCHRICVCSFWFDCANAGFNGMRSKVSRTYYPA
jgi:hypothetical protein